MVLVPRPESHTTPSYGTINYLAAKHHASSSSSSQEPPTPCIKDPDFIAVGLGGTNMLAMLYALAMGKRSVGIDMRGDPFLGVHWNIRPDLYHQLGLLDALLLARHGAARLPKKQDGSLFSLADTFYHPSTISRDIIPDAVASGYDSQCHMTGRILDIEYIDDRWKGGQPHRAVSVLPPPDVPQRPDPGRIRSDMRAVLDGPSTWQSGALYIQIMLRRYLEQIEAMDLESSSRAAPPRVRLFTHHRVVQDGSGYVALPCGRVRVRVEQLTELDYHGTLTRLRTPGSHFTDLGVAELVSVATGASSRDASMLGFQQREVHVDHGDGAGPKVAQADFVACQIEVLVGGRLRRRIGSVFDARGNEFWARQIAVGHEGDPRICWLVVEVPPFVCFCPVERGLVAPGTAKGSAEYFAAYQVLLYDYYIEQAALVLDVPAEKLREVGVVYGPKPFSLVEKMGRDAKVAANAVVAGDSFGNGHFLHSAGAMCGMIGHAYRFYEYWNHREAGLGVDVSVRQLADSIKRDTEMLLEVSAKEFSQAVPVNFGRERGAVVAGASGIDPERRATVGEAGAGRERFEQAPLNPTDWRRLFIRNGKVETGPLPEISPVHPALRGREEKMEESMEKMNVS